MGYYTSFEMVSITGTRDNWVTGVDEQGETHRVNIGIDMAKVIFEMVQAISYDPFADACKWYSHEDDMKSFSRNYPTLVFTLKGEGEEAGDMWYKYFRNGKMQKAPAIVTYPDFDENLLV
jgi:hypothetical protein